MVDPRLRILLVVATGILAISLDHAVALGALTCITGIAALSAGLPARWRGRTVAIIFAVIWPTVLSQAIFYGDQPRTAVIALGPLTIWQEGMIHGFVQSLRFVSVSLAGVALAISTPPEKLLIGLQRLGLPSGLCFLTVTALRFIPTVGTETLWVREARRHRGRSLWRRSPLAWLKIEIGLTRPILARALRRSRALAASMDTRGFDPSARRDGRGKLTWRSTDTFIALTAATVCVCVVASRVAYVLYTLDLAYHPSLRWVYGLVRTWL
jgi:energy-coupling factor transport system permease protein